MACNFRVSGGRLVADHRLRVRKLNGVILTAQAVTCLWNGLVVEDGAGAAAEAVENGGAIVAVAVEATGVTGVTAVTVVAVATAEDIDGTVIHALGLSSPSLCAFRWINADDVLAASGLPRWV